MNAPEPSPAGRAAPALVAVLGRGVMDPDAPVLTGDDLGLVRGDGCFDSTRVVTGADGRSHAENLGEHLDRLAASAAEMEIDSPSHAQWARLIDDLLAAWQTPGEAVLKLILTRGREWAPGPPTALATLVYLAPAQSAADPAADPASVDGNAPGSVAAARRGISIVTLSKGHPSDAYVDAPWLLGGVKTLSYVVNVSAQREARRRGADDVLFVTTDGYCLDGPTSGLVVVDGRRLRSTPTGGTGLLPSVTAARTVQEARRDGMDADYELIPVGDLLHADGVWLVSSGRGAAPVTHVDGRPIRVDPELVARVARYAGFPQGGPNGGPDIPGPDVPGPEVPPAGP